MVKDNIVGHFVELIHKDKSQIRTLCNISTKATAGRLVNDDDSTQFPGNKLIHSQLTSIVFNIEMVA
jgi:hypothetical protein